jgi:hypothetical protein
MERGLILRIFLSLILLSIQAKQSHACEFDELVFIGVNRTDKSWLQDYLEIPTFPVHESKVDLPTLQKKIMTTDVFVDAQVQKKEKSNNSCALEISITEKWTTIPVIRGAYGGGTPLVILGGYETHAGGRLYSLGGEVRRYGNRPPGFFLFAKSPRAWRGKGSYGSEIWLDRRRRTFFDSDGKAVSYADSEAFTMKVQLLLPSELLMDESSHWQFGAQVDLIHENPTVFTDVKGIETPSLQPDDVVISESPLFTASIMPLLVYDNIDVNKIQMDGPRLLLKTGAQITSKTRSSTSEVEFFGYHSEGNLNLAVHAFGATQGDQSLKNLYFLGGFDSVRGLPDGIHYGNKIAYANSELRWLAMESKYLHMQTAAFADHGTAFTNSEHALESRETSVGFGVRLSVPQVYRLLLRIDYGWSVGSIKSQGLSIGLGQFFQPYKFVF